MTLLPKFIDDWVSKYPDEIFAVLIAISFLYSVAGSIGEFFEFISKNFISRDFVTVISAIFVPVFTIIFIIDGFCIYFVWKRKREKIESVACLKAEIEEKNQEIDRLRNNIDEKEAEEKANIRKDVEKYIKNIAINRLEFNTHKFEDRISLYVHDEKRNKFFLIYRFSRNPTLKSRGRPYYSDSIGAISEAWKYGSSIRSYSWKYEDSPVKYSAEFILKDPGFDINQIDGLRMKPAQIVAIRLDTGAGTPYGIVVLESNEQFRFNKDAVDAIFNNCANAIEGLSNKLSTYMSKFDEQNRVLFHEQT